MTTHEGLIDEGEIFSRRGRSMHFEALTMLRSALRIVPVFPNTDDHNYYDVIVEFDATGSAPDRVAAYVQVLDALHAEIREAMDTGGLPAFMSIRPTSGQQFVNAHGIGGVGAVSQRVGSFAHDVLGRLCRDGALTAALREWQIRVALDKLDA